MEKAKFGTPEIHAGRLVADPQRFTRVEGGSISFHLFKHEANQPPPAPAKKLAGFQSRTLGATGSLFG